jgi:RNA polymerase sigma-70 factor (ECF subfamily)
LQQTEENNSVCLVDQARTDKTAFAELYRRHYDEIYRYCARRLPGQATAEDVTSQVFMKMVKNFNSFMGDESAFRCWLFRIACNEINSYFRKSGRHNKAMETVRQEQDLDDHIVESPHEDAEENQHKMTFLKDAISQLKPAYQDILTLRFFKNLNSEQIGKMLNIKPATVRSQLSRAIKQLKKEYKKHKQHSTKGICWYE